MKKFELLDWRPKNRKYYLSLSHIKTKAKDILILTRIELCKFLQNIIKNLFLLRG